MARVLPRSLVVVLAAAFGVPTLALAQDEAPEWAQQTALDPDDPAVQEYAQRQKRRVDAERQLYQIRAKYFRNIRNTQIRQVGIAKLREFTDSAVFPSLLNIFAREDDDVRFAILDHLADQRTADADVTLAWAAVFDESRSLRRAAAERVVRRTGEERTISNGISSAVALGLKDPNDWVVSSAARLAQVLKLYEAIPMLINGQVTGQSAQLNAGSDREGSLAWILVGRQQAFVSDLTPVVGDSAVGFDPTISVVTEGVFLRVIDAVVYTYRADVHSALIGLASDAMGQPTELGWDNREWRRWYREELEPKLPDLVKARSPGPAPQTPGSPSGQQPMAEQPAPEQPMTPATPSAPPRKGPS